MENSEKRKREQSIIYERMAEKELSRETTNFGQKEKFITESYDFQYFNIANKGGGRNLSYKSFFFFAAFYTISGGRKETKNFLF
jgi:hypothetical protein